MRSRVASFTAGLIAARAPVGRTRKSVAFLTVCLAAAVSVLVGGTSVAKAAGCGTIGSAYVGALPNIGQTISASIKQVSSNANNNNGVQVHGMIILDSGSETIGVGIRSMGDGLGPEWVAEKDNHTISSSLTFASQYEKFAITRTSSTNYTLKIDPPDGDTFNTTLPAPSNAESLFWGYSSSPSGGPCATFDYYFNNLVSPFNCNVMHQEVDDPPFIKTYSASEFEVDE